jgi:hypothetical protein
MLDSIKNTYFTHSAAITLRPDFFREDFKVMGETVGAAVAEAIVLVPRMVVGTKTAPTVPSMLRYETAPSRPGLWGLLNRVAFDASCWTGVLIGAIVGFPAALVGAAVGGSDTFSSIMNCMSSFGSRLGALVATLPVAVSEMARSLAATGMRSAVEQTSMAMGSIGEVLQIAKDMVVE